MSSSMESHIEPLLHALEYVIQALERTFSMIPGSAVVARYVKSSHQNDPGRTVLEVILFLFAIITLFQSRTRSEASGKHFIKFSEKEINELVDEWTPEPLLEPLTADEEADLASVPVITGPSGPRPMLMSTSQSVANLTSFNFAGLLNDEHIKTRAIQTLRKYGLGSCGPPGFYGTFDAHIDLERDIAAFLGTEAAIIYSQAFATISSVIPAFCKRGDIIVADVAVNFAIRKGIQNSRSTVRWFAHNDLKNLEEVLQGVDRERRKKRGRLTRRFIITEGIFEVDGEMVDLPKLVALKSEYKYRLLLDETFSVGAVGKTGRGLTEFFDVPPASIDILVGSFAHSLCAAGGFCAGSVVAIDHQRINSTSFVFSAAMPVMLAVCASEGIAMLKNSPKRFTTLQDNIRGARRILADISEIETRSHPSSPIIHIRLRNTAATLQVPGLHSGSEKTRGLSSAQPKLILHAQEEKILQHVVDAALSRGVLITRARRLKGQEATDVRPSIRLSITAAMTRAETETAVAVVRDALASVLSSSL